MCAELVYLISIFACPPRHPLSGTSRAALSRGAVCNCRDHNTHTHISNASAAVIYTYPHTHIHNNYNNNIAFRFCESELRTGVERKQSIVHGFQPEI